MKQDVNPDAHVVVASGPAEAGSIVGPKLYAVVAGSVEQAEAAVQAIVPEDTVVAAAGGPLTNATVAGLALTEGEVKQIG